MKYIDAEKLKKIVEQAKQRALKGVEVDKDMYCDGRADAFEEVLLEIDSLQQKQPVEGLDLDSEIFAWQKAHANEDTAQEIAMTARHFAEWGAEHAKK